MAIPSSSSSDNEVNSCSPVCIKAYKQLHGQYDSQTIELRKSRLDVVSYQAALESVESRVVVYKQNESIFQDNIIVLTNEISLAKPTEDLSHTNRPSVPIIEEWVSDSEDGYETTAPQIAHSSVQPICVDVPKIMMTRPRHAHSLNTRSNSTIRRHKTYSHSLNTSNSSLKVTAAKAPVVSAAMGKKGKWVWRPKCPILDHDSRTTDYELATRLRGEEQRRKPLTKAYQIYHVTVQELKKCLDTSS
nr:hypothetical protein [Tanacetum cinerariifolium]GEY70290.1 hypothetical protein [Tanacetum cinerariifolium]